MKIVSYTQLTQSQLPVGTAWQEIKDFLAGLAKSVQVYPQPDKSSTTGGWVLVEGENNFQDTLSINSLPYDMNLEAFVTS